VTCYGRRGGRFCGPHSNSLEAWYRAVSHHFIAHESHHRGNTLLTLKQSGHKIDKTVQYAIWDWDRLQLGPRTRILREP